MAGAQSSMLGPLAVVIGAMVLGTVAGGDRGLAPRPGRRIRSPRAWTSCSRSPASCWRCWRPPIFGAGLTAAAISLAIAYMPYVARVLRGAALKERSQAYVAALEVQGASATSICLRHIVPEHAAADRRAGHHHVRLRDGRPRGDVVPRPRRPAARAELGRDDLGEPDRHPRRATRCPRWPPGSASWA